MPPEPLCWPILGLCWPICCLCWGHVRPSWGYVGAMLPHLGPLLDHVVGDVGPSGTPRGDLEPCCFHDFTSFPKFCLKKLSPVACEASTPFLQHYFSEKAESCWGRVQDWRLPPVACEVPGNASRGSEEGSAAPGGFPVAEAKVQATTSLTLHGMAGLYGLRPAPAMPGEEMGREGSRTRIL